MAGSTYIQRINSGNREVNSLDGSVPSVKTCSGQRFDQPKGEEMRLLIVSLLICVASRVAFTDEGNEREPRNKADRKTVVPLRAGGSRSAKADTSSPADNREEVPLELDPKCRTVLANVLSFYEKTRTLKVESTLEVTVKGEQRMGKIRNTKVISFARPDRMSFIDDRETGLSTFVSGNTLTMYLPIRKRFVQQKAPESMDAMLGTHLSAVPGGPLGSFLLQFLCEHPEAVILKGVRSARYVGRNQIDGLDADGIEFQQKASARQGGGDIRWTMWTAATDRPALLQIEFEVERTLTRAKESRRITQVIQEQFRDWEFDLKLSEDMFEFMPPEGVVKADRLFERPPSREKPGTTK